MPIKRAFGALALVPLVALGLFSQAGAASARSGSDHGAQATVVLRFAGLSRTGAKVRVNDAVVDASNDATWDTFGRNWVRVPAGRYLVGAQVPTYLQGTSTLSSETLVVRSVDAQRSALVTMDARAGKLVRVSLDAAGARQQSLTAMACLGVDSGGPITAAAEGGPGVKVYATPIRSDRVRFSYLSSWQGPAGGYQLAGSRLGEIPARPVFPVDAKSLATVQLTLRAGTAADDADLQWAVQPSTQFSVCDDQYGFGGQVSAPYSATFHRSPGAWTTDVLGAMGTPEDGLWYTTRTYRSSRSYADTFGAAAVGPQADSPTIEGNIFRFAGNGLFAEAGIYGDECCAKSRVSLSLNGRVVRHFRLNEWRGSAYYQTVLHTSGWYTMTVDATRWSPYETEPSWLLSPRVTVNWRFHVAPAAPNGFSRPFPVSLTTYEPEGLSVSNDAAPGAVTPVRFDVDKVGAMAGTRHSSYPVRTVKVEASFNDGTSWQPLRVVRHGSYWLARVSDPASGYVSLRSTVANGKGDSTVETIYRAYGIS